ncbi:MAG: hypothetical protein R3A51_13570 [Nannocystaceae bacterium]|nr:hypothetical protein [Myxococcales bacterium]
MGAFFALEATRDLWAPPPDIVVVEAAAARCECPEPPPPAACEVEPGVTIELVPEPPPLPASTGARPVLDGRVILHTDADASWGQGALVVDPDAATFAVSKAAALEAIPAEQRAALGRPVILYGPEGQVCSGAVSGLRVTARAAGDLIFMAEELDEDDANLDPEAADDAAFAEPVYGSGPWLLEAEVSAADSCRGALWAHFADERAPVVFPRGAAQDEVDRQALARAWEQVEATNVYRSVRAEYRDFRSALEGDEADALEVPAWREYVAANRTLEVFRDAEGRPRYISAVLGSPDEFGCGDFDLTVTAFLEVDGDAVRVLSTRLGHTPLAVFDGDGDGAIELITGPAVSLHRGHYRWSGERFTLLEDLTVPFQGCPC